MLKRADAKARDSRHDQLTALVKAGVEAGGQHIMTEADAFVGDLRGTTAAELGKAVISQGHALPEIVGDHGGFPVMRAVIRGERYHGAGLSRAEETAEDGEFSHGSNLPCVSVIRLLYRSARETASRRKEATEW